jgi:hypothetical protein
MQIYPIINLKYGRQDEVYFLFNGFTITEQQMR